MKAEWLRPDYVHVQGEGPLAPTDTSKFLSPSHRQTGHYAFNENAIAVFVHGWIQNHYD